MEEILNSAHHDYKTEIAEIIKSNLTPTRIREKLWEYHENDIAAALELLSAEERNKLYSILSVEILADVLEYSEQSGKYLDELNIRKRVDILSEIEVSVAVAYLKSLEKKDRNTVIELLPAEQKKEIFLLASFDEDEIGSKMTTNYIAIIGGLEVKEAMTELIRQAATNDNVSTIYIIDEEDTFVGAMDLKDLIRARAGRTVDDIMITSYPYVYANEQIDDCLERIKGYSEDTIPVLDRENRLCGVLTAHDLAQMIEDEIGDDYAKLGGLTSEEDLREPLFKSLGKRLPWLLVLFGMGFIVSSVVGLFDSVVSGLPLIVSFQSLILGMAGNVGTQSLAVTIRALSDESLGGRQKAYLVFKEARVGFFNGLLLGASSFLIIGAYLFFLKGEALTLSFAVSGCTGIALLVSMLLSSVSGTTIPLVFKKIGIDPAVASGPFITTINDLVAVVTYYGLAWALLAGIIGI